MSAESQQQTAHMSTPRVPATVSQMLAASTAEHSDSKVHCRCRKQCSTCRASGPLHSFPTAGSCLSQACTANQVLQAAHKALLWMRSFGIRPPLAEVRLGHKLGCNACARQTCQVSCQRECAKCDIARVGHCTEGTRHATTQHI